MIRRAALLALLLTSCAVHSPRDMPYQEAVSRAAECRFLYPQPDSSGPFGLFSLVHGLWADAQFSDCVGHYGFSSKDGR